MVENNAKIFWERVNYSTSLKYGKDTVEKVFKDEEILNKRILDVGCGSGVYSLIFKQKGAREVVGVDLSVSSIKKAKEELERGTLKNVQFLNLDIRNYNFHEESFDIIWCYGIFYYLPDPYDIMKEICELTLKGGTIFVTFIKNTNYSKIINSIRKILYHIPKSLWGITSLVISSLIFSISFIFKRETDFSRIRTKVLAQYFPVLWYLSVENAETFFLKNGFKTEKILYSMDAFSPEFGLKLKKLA